MCPACYAALAWTVAGYATAGGVVTVGVVKVVKRKRGSESQPTPVDAKASGK